MRTIPFEHDGQTWYLCLNGSALYDIYDKYGTEGSVLDPIRGDTAAAFSALCWYLAKLGTQGELVRRWEGHDPGFMPVEARFRATLSPHDTQRARAAVAAAVAEGFRRDAAPPAPKEIDLGLRELEKKTDTAKGGATIYRPLRSFWAFLSGRGLCC